MISYSIKQLSLESPHQWSGVEQRILEYYSLYHYLFVTDIICEIMKMEAGFRLLVMGKLLNKTEVNPKASPVVWC